MSYLMPFPCNTKTINNAKQSFSSQLNNFYRSCGWSNKFELLEFQKKHTVLMHTQIYVTVDAPSHYLLNVTAHSGVIHCCIFFSRCGD